MENNLERKKILPVKFYYEYITLFNWMLKYGNKYIRTSIIYNYLNDEDFLICKKIQYNKDFVEGKIDEPNYKRNIVYFNDIDVDFMTMDKDVCNFLTWKCPVKFVREFLYNNYGIKTKWYHKIFWKGYIKKYKYV